eukprot:14832074-Alexandrium_andersonii.AAC.1
MDIPHVQHQPPPSLFDGIAGESAVTIDPPRLCPPPCPTKAGGGKERIHRLPGRRRNNSGEGWVGNKIPRTLASSRHLSPQ